MDAAGEFLPLPEFDAQALLHAWEEAVYALYLREGKIEEEVVETMRGWEHSGFSVDQSVHLAAGDQAGIERRMQYMVRCPFSLSRIIKVTDDGMVVYRSKRQHVRAFPDLAGDGLKAGARRNFQILSPLDFLAEFTQHIPPKGAHLVRYYGWYSNKARGVREKEARALANLVFWAAAQGAVLDAPLVKKLMAEEAPLVRENTLRQAGGRGGRRR
ncbi:MAG TPA: transposase [Phycisphaerae bacterium]|nr:transposase [Phycisphaerae bacterium]